MATDAIRYRRQNREQSARAAKARREKIILIVGFALLLGIVAFEGPKTLKRLQGSSASSAPAQAAATPATATPAVPAKPVNLKSLARFAARDPFVPQVVTGTSAGPTVTPATAPAVRASHFVEKDPFVQQLSIAPTATPATAPAAGKGAEGGPKAQPVQPVLSGSGAYIVIVASVPVGQGRLEALRQAGAARARGIPGVKIVVSSDYPTLREGYFAVYSGPYKTLAAARQAAASIRGQGYFSAYTRRLGH